MAWLMAPAPMAWTSTLDWDRMTPAMAPATATGLLVADTLRTSTGTIPLCVDDVGGAAAASVSTPSPVGPCMDVKGLWVGPGILSKVRRPGRPNSDRAQLLGVLHRARLPQHRDLDLPRIGQLTL